MEPLLHMYLHLQYHLHVQYLHLHVQYLQYHLHLHLHPAPRKRDREGLEGKGAKVAVGGKEGKQVGGKVAKVKARSSPTLARRSSEEKVWLLLFLFLNFL